MGLLLGYVVDVVVGAVMQMDEIDNGMKSRVIRALNKVVWLQNDLFAWHYIPEGKETVVVDGEKEKVEEGSKGVFGRVMGLMK